MKETKNSNMEWQDDFGIDPRSKANIRRNGKSLPQGIDWEALMTKGLKGSKGNKTSLGLINDQQSKK